jgi:hypothetical protein
MIFRLVKDADPLPHLPIEHGRNGEGVGSWVPDMKHTFLAKYVEGTRLNSSHVAIEGLSRMPSSA